MERESGIHGTLPTNKSVHNGKIVLSCDEENMREVEHRRAADSKKMGSGVECTGWGNALKVILCVPPAPFT